jgi:hypothetical protein
MVAPYSKTGSERVTLHVTMSNVKRDVAQMFVDRMVNDTLVLLTDSSLRPIVHRWEELTPRGNMVKEGVEREDGVQAQLVLGSLKSSQDLRRT